MPGAFDDIQGKLGTQSGRQPEMARSYEPSWRDDISSGWRSILAKLGAVSPEGRMSPSEERLVGGLTGSTGLTGRLGDTPSIPVVDAAGLAAGITTGGWPGYLMSGATSYADLFSGLSRGDSDMALNGAAGVALGIPMLHGLGRGIGKVTSTADPATDTIAQTNQMSDDVAKYLEEANAPKIMGGSAYVPRDARAKFSTAEPRFDASFGNDNGRLRPIGAFAEPLE